MQIAKPIINIHMCFGFRIHGMLRRVKHKESLTLNMCMVHCSKYIIVSIDVKMLLYRGPWYLDKSIKEDAILII